MGDNEIMKELYKYFGEKKEENQEIYSIANIFYEMGKEGDGHEKIKIKQIKNFENVEEKKCTKCGKKYPKTKEYFYYNDNYGRLKSECKECSKEYMKIKRSNKEQIKGKAGRPKTIVETGEDLKCRICGETFPYTSEYFPINKAYKSGLETRCRTCQTAYEREKYAQRRAKQNKKYKPVTEYQELVEERDKREAEIYKKLISEPRDKGIGDKLDTLKFKEGKKYKINRRKNKENDYEDYFIGVVEQDCKDHVTLKHKKGYCESFRKYDILCGEYKLKEV